MAREIDQKTRRRIAGNMRRLKHEYEFRSDAAMGRFLGVSRGAVNRARKGERTAGLDLLLAVHRKFGQSMDAMCDKDDDWLDPSYKPPRPKKPDGG